MSPSSVSGFGATHVPVAVGCAVVQSPLLSAARRHPRLSPTGGDRVLPSDVVRNVAHDSKHMVLLVYCEGHLLVAVEQKAVHGLWVLLVAAGVHTPDAVGPASLQLAATELPPMALVSAVRRHSNESPVLLL